ncbi:MAG: MFS transporter [bacterium]|nr:MFS transporter [bacterium]
MEMNSELISRSVQRRMTVTLFAAQSLFSASTIMSFTLMPILAAQLSGSDGAAGVPPTMMMLGRAVAAYPVGWLMDRVGRRPGLTLGYFLAALGAALSVFSVGWVSFAGFCAGSLLMGMGRGVSEQARFVAAEVQAPDRRASTIGLIVFAGTVGAVGGPLLVDPSGQIAALFGMQAHAGPYLLGTVFTALAMGLTFVFLRPDPMYLGRTMTGGLQGRAGEEVGRPLMEIFADGTVRLGVASMVIGQLVMTLIMVITPLHMDHHAHGAKAISWVIMAHTLGMYGLSSLTGRLVDRFGRVPVVLVGGLVLVVSAVLTPMSNEVPMLAFALFLLGLGWNFCFIAGSSMLSEALASCERGRAQGASEVMVAVAAGAGSLGTGAVFVGGGMVAVSAVGLGFSLVLIAGISWGSRRYSSIPAGE